jgi:hypothetical protein
MLKNDFNKIALILACKNLHFEIINYLCENGADVSANDYNNHKVSNGLEAVKLVLNNGGDANANLNDGRPVLLGKYFLLTANAPRM